MDNQNTPRNLAYFSDLLGKGCSLKSGELYSTIRIKKVHTVRYLYPLIFNKPSYREILLEIIPFILNAKKIEKNLFSIIIF